MKKTYFVLFAAIIIILAIAVVIIPRYLSPQAPEGEHSVDGLMGLRSNRTEDGNWVIYEMGGSHPISELRLQVINSSTGATTVDVRFSDILPNKNHTDAVLNDSNSNKKFDAGDSIILKGSSPNIQLGYKVQIIDKAGTVIGTIKELQ